VSREPSSPFVGFGDGLRMELVIVIEPGANSENIDLELASVLGSDSLTLLGMLPQNARQSVLDCCPTTLVIGFGRA
jgi:hypothetical protein